MPSVVFRDIDLRFKTHPNTNKLVVSEGDEAVKRALHYLLLTMKGERLFQPDFGSNLRRLLFENISISTSMDIKSVVTEAIRNYEARVDLIKILVTPDKDRNGYTIQLTYNILNQTIPQTVTLFLERLR